MNSQGCCSKFFQSSMPYIAMILLQLCQGGLCIISKASLNTGMSHYVLVVYRHAFAAAAIAPFALFLERKVHPKMTFSILMQIFVLGLLGPVLDQNFFYAGLKFASANSSIAIVNMLPAVAFVMAVLCRMEKLDMKRVRGQAKVAGTFVTVAGAILMTFYKGPIMEMVWYRHIHPHESYATKTTEVVDRDWIKGSIFVFISVISWAAFFILQNITMRRYQAPLSLTSLVCIMGTLQSIIVTLVMEHKTSAWTIGWDMNLFSAAYSGIVTSSIAYYVQGLVMKRRGPIFVTSFSPLMMITVAIMGSFTLGEKIYLGGVIGSVLIVAGLCSILWGKYKEQQEKKAMEAAASATPEAIKDIEENGHMMDVIEADKAKTHGNLSSSKDGVAITCQNKL